MNEELLLFLEKELETKVDIPSLLEKPKHESHGDVSLPCFLLAKEQGKNPVQVAKELEETLTKKLPSSIEKIVATGPFLNFYLNNSLEIQKIVESFYSGDLLTATTAKPKKILIEYPSPNTNKALHIGHTRNILLGNTLCLLNEKYGNEIIKANLNNDRGIAICKALLSYKLFGENKQPEDLDMKPDQFAEHWYVLFGKKAKEDLSLEEQAQSMLVDWEAGDKETRELWKKFLAWVYQGYEVTLEKYKYTKPDVVYYESEVYDKGKEVVLKALEEKAEGFGREEDGAVFVDLEELDLGKKYLLRGDGTTLYMTQDIYLATLKENEFKPDLSIFIVGEEQQYHFKVLFEILRRLNLGGPEKNMHYSYGYVYDKNGKKFSSRKGEVVGAEWLLEQTTNRAKGNIKQKELTKNLDEEEIDRRAAIIGYGSLAFFILKTSPTNAIHFDIEKALSFEGETGPYVQYSYARIQSLLKKGEFSFKEESLDVTDLNEYEVQLMKTCKEYSSVFEDAVIKLKPSLIAHYLIKLCQTYNEFYQNVQILKGDKTKVYAKLMISHIVAETIKEGLGVLGIDVLEEM